MTPPCQKLLLRLPLSRIFPSSGGPQMLCCGPGSCGGGGTWWVAGMSFSQKTNGAKVIKNPTNCGCAVFPEKSFPTQSGTLWQEFQLTINIGNPSLTSSMSVTLVAHDVYNWIYPNGGNVIPIGPNLDNNPNTTFSLSTPITISIPAGSSSYTITDVSISNAHAGDNWVVEASWRQPGMSIDSHSYSEPLTVWRTLNVECDTMQFPPYPGMPILSMAPKDYLGDFVESELARACIVIKDITPDPNTQPPAGDLELTPSHSDIITGGVGTGSGRDIDGNCKEFWQTRIVMTSWNGDPDGPYGVVEHNTILVFYALTALKVDKQNNSGYYYKADMAKNLSRTILHEIGHILMDNSALDHTSEDSIMSTQVHIVRRTNPDNLKFLPAQLMTIQKNSRVKE